MVYFTDCEVFMSCTWNGFRTTKWADIILVEGEYISLKACWFMAGLTLSLFGAAAPVIWFYADEHSFDIL